jgi:hypothetical protein
MEESTWIDILFEESTCIATFLFVGAFVGIFDAIQFKRGKMRDYFLPLPMNLVIPANGHYGGWPGGIASLLMGIGYVTDNRVIAIIGVAIFPLALVLMVWKPRWLKPDWLLWLEAHYDEDVIDFMFKQARNEKKWGKRVSTQEGLETWAEETAQKYYLYNY